MKSVVSKVGGLFAPEARYVYRHVETLSLRQLHHPDPSAKIRPDVVHIFK